MNFPMINLTNYEDQLHNTETVNRPKLRTQKSSVVDPDLAKLAFAFGQYLNGLPGAQAYASEACKVVYQQIPDDKLKSNVSSRILRPLGSVVLPFETLLWPYGSSLLENIFSIGIHCMSLEMLWREEEIFSFSTCNYADQIKPLIQRTPTESVHGCLLQNSGLLLRLFEECHAG